MASVLGSRDHHLHRTKKQPSTAGANFGIIARRRDWSTLRPQQDRVTPGRSRLRDKPIPAKRGRPPPLVYCGGTCTAPRPSGRPLRASGSSSSIHHHHGDDDDGACSPRGPSSSSSHHRHPGGGACSPLRPEAESCFAQAAHGDFLGSCRCAVGCYSTGQCSAVRSSPCRTCSARPLPSPSPSPALWPASRPMQRGRGGALEN